MIGTGTIANVLAIIVGGSLGLLAKGGLKEHYQEGILKALGLATLFIGASGALAGMLTAENGVLSSAGTGKTLAMILALALGALAGEFIDLDRRMEQLGAWLKAKADRGGDSQFIQGLSPPPSLCASERWPLWAPSRTASPATRPPCTPNPSWTL